MDATMFTILHILSSVFPGYVNMHAACQSQAERDPRVLIVFRLLTGMVTLHLA
jgi:hypothetical protein